MAPVRISYYSDVLCIWAYAAQRRLEQLVQKFGDEISIDAHFCSVFPDAWGKIEDKWKARGGFEGFNRHTNEVVVSDSWWKLVFGVAPDHDGCSIRRRGQSAA